MISIGGIIKPKKFFNLVHKTLSFDKDYRVYYAYDDDKIIACLLIFYFKDTVEYFTPAIVHEFRNKQPLSLLVFEAMVDAITEKQSKIWNWGGTWQSQKTLLKFKKKWNTINTEYRYLIKINKKLTKVELLNKNKLQKLYRFFYTVPFNSNWIGIVA